MYFDSKRRGKKGLPWFGGRTDYEKRSDEYYEKLEELVEQIDDVEYNTPFMTGLDPDDYNSGYQYVSARLRELGKYLKQDNCAAPVDKEDWLDRIDEIRNELEDLETDADLYDDIDDDPDWDIDDDDDWDDYKDDDDDW